MKKILTTLSQKWPEYLLEMLVITAGILGAFMLNSWNESRLNIAKEAILLQEINTEFRINKAQLEIVVSSHENTLKSINWVRKRYPFDQPHDSLDYYLQHVFMSYTFNPSNSSVNSLISSSSFEIVSDLELRKLLVQWTDIAFDYQEEETLNKDFVLNTLVPFHIKNLQTNEPSQRLFQLSNELKLEYQNMLDIRVLLIEQILGNQEAELAILQKYIDQIILLTDQATSKD